jgi:hypothetical protein
LARCKVKSTHLPSPKSLSILRPVKDILGLKAAGVYKISSECGAVNISETDHTIAEGKQHQRQLRCYHPELSAVEQQFSQPGAPDIL